MRLGGILLVFACISVPAWAKPVTYGYRIIVRSQLGSFLTEPFSDLATNRLMLDMSQSLKRSEWLYGAVSVRTRAEAAYGSNTERYSAMQAREESSEISLRDTYLQLKRKSVSLKLGYQTVVWGEAFGFFFADLVNPKDLRESILTGLFDQADLELPIPLANLQWFGSDSSIQLLYGPDAYTNKLPTKTSSYFPLAVSNFGITLDQLTVKTDPELDEAKGDYGGRISYRIYSLDLSVFGWNHLDHMPYFRLISYIPGVSMNLEERQARVMSYGLTATFETGSLLWRSELVRTDGRKFNVLSTGVLTNRDFTESVAVLGVDLPTIDKWTVGLQGSYNWLSSSSVKPIIRETSTGTLGIRLARDYLSGQGLEFTHLMATHDGSSLSTLKWNFARSSRLEYILGVESMQGHRGSNFGAFREQSRFLIGIRGVFDG